MTADRARARVEQLRLRGMSRRRAEARVEREMATVARLAAASPGGVPAFDVQRTPGGLLRFACPACGGGNLHGGDAGHRASHCGCWPAGYILREVPP